MAEGILGILKYINRNTDLDKQEQRIEQEIAARRNADIAVQAAQQAELRKTQDIERVNQQKSMFNALRNRALIEGRMAGFQGADAEQYANNMAQKRMEEMTISGALADVDKSLESSAMSKYNTQRINSQLGTAGQLGQLQGETNIAGQQNALQGAQTAGKVTSALSHLAPIAAQLGQQAQIGQAQNDITRQNTLSNYIPQLTQSEAQSGITKGQAEAAKNTVEAGTFSKIDPGMAAQAQAAQYQGETQAPALRAIQTLGSMQPSTFSQRVSDQIPTEWISQLLSTAMPQRAPSTPASIANPTTLTNRGVLMNINQLKPQGR